MRLPHHLALVIRLCVLLWMAFGVGVCDNLVNDNSIDATNHEASPTPTTGDGDADEPPSEVQKVICMVTAGETRASAEATTTKTLKGVCGSAELQAAFHELETKVLRELLEIKALLLQQQQQQHHHHQPQQQLHHQPLQPQQQSQPVANQNSNISKNVFSKPTTTATTTSSTNTTSVHRTTSAPLTTPSNASGKKSTFKLKSLPSGGGGGGGGAQPTATAPTRSSPPSPQREQEVHKFNNTYLTDRELKFFTYYWKLENFSDYLTSLAEQRIESPIFVIKSKALHIIAHFHHLHRDLLYLQMEEAKLQSNNRYNIMLDTNPRAATFGNLFKEILTDDIVFKHKISILDQQQPHGKDLASQELNKLEMGFLIPHSALNATPYVKDNALLVQILIYL